MAPAGWYEDGVTAGQERYWDGQAWTNQFRPLAAAQQPVAQEPVAEAPGAEQPVVEQPVVQEPVAEQPGPAVAAPAKGGMPKGLLIGLIVGGVVLVVGVVLAIVFFVFLRTGLGGGPSAAEQRAYLQTAQEYAASAGVTFSDQQLLEVGTKLCEAAAKVDPNNPMSMLNVLGEITPLMSDVMLFGVASASIEDLCPDVYARLEGLG